MTAEVLGNRVERLYDVGVAGIHRLLSNLEKLNEANIIITVAGMEGALASGIGVVNIDNGFGAAYLASTINLQIEKARKSE